MFMKMKGSMAKISIKRLHEEHRLGILRRHLLHRIRIDQPKPYRIKWILWVIAQKLLYRPKLAGLRKTSHRPIFIPDNNFVGVRHLAIAVLRPYA